MQAFQITDPQSLTINEIISKTEMVSKIFHAQRALLDVPENDIFADSNCKQLPKTIL